MKTGETRKLVKWGSSKTLIMSLPRAWTKKHELTEANEVQVFENPDGSLLIMPFIMEETESKMMASVDAEKYPDMKTLSYVIQTKFLDGNDVIKIESKAPFTQDKYIKISSLVASLLGFEILSKTPNVVIIKDIMALKETSLNELIKMVSRNVLELMNNFIYAVENGDQAVAQAVLSSRDNINRYYLRVHRQLRKGLIQPSILMKMKINTQDAMDFAFFIVTVNDVAENLGIMSHSFLKQTSETTIETIPILRMTYELLTEAISAFLFNKTKEAIEVLNKLDDSKEKKREVEMKIDAKTSPETTSQIILDHCEKIIESCKTIGLCALRRTL